MYLYSKEVTGSADFFVTAFQIMKLEKSVIDRRLKLMEAEGVKFVTNTNVGVDITAEELLKKYDRVILCCGASNPRDIKVPGRDAKGIYFAVDFLKKVTKTLLDSDFTKAPYEEARGKHVLVIGGGDTGNDCVVLPYVSAPNL